MTFREKLALVQAQLVELRKTRSRAVVTCVGNHVVVTITTRPL